MRGDMIVPAAQREPPYWRMNRAENMLMLSSYHLAESSAARVEFRRQGSADAWRQGLDLWFDARNGE